MEAPSPSCLPPDHIGPLPLGVHSGLPVTLLPETQAAFAINATMRGGYAHTRPPIVKRNLQFTDETTQLGVTMGRFQGAATYRSFGGNPDCIIASVGGYIYRFTPSGPNVAVDDITPSTVDAGSGDRIPNPNNPTREQAWLAQGQDFMVINDGESHPIFYDGAVARRSGGYAAQELPPGRAIHYVNGRFVEVLLDGISYIASDLVYSRVSGTPKYNYRDAILRIKDNLSILAGQAFAVPLTAGSINALFSAAVPDTSLGQGPLQLGTDNGVYSAILPLDATLWTTTQQPVQTVALPDGGVSAFYATPTVNSDVWYRAPDGIRSYKVARRDFSDEWVNTPLSFEMERILPFDTKQLLKWGSAVNFNKRLLMTCSPYRFNERGIAHRGLVALDFANITSITTRSQPCYDGLWTGLPILQVVAGEFAGVRRCFLFALDGAGQICLYEVSYDDSLYFDHDGTNNVLIASTLYSGALLGREGIPDTLSQRLKRLLTVDYYLERLAGAVTVTTSFTSDGFPCWQEWAEFGLCATACVTQTNCTQPTPTRTQYATFKRLPDAPSECNELTNRPHREGYYFELKVELLGHWQLKRANIWAIAAPATRNVACGTESCKVVQCCLDNPFTYTIETPTPGYIEWDTNWDQPVWDVPTDSTITVT